MVYPVDPKNLKYNHAEAFCLMYYRSNQGIASKEFWVWNSRDGVTPFCIIEDGVEYQHDKWHLDKCVPNFQLTEGHRFFRDTTPAEAAYIALKRMQLYNGKYFTGPESERLLPDTKLWYETWARVTESFIGQPIVMRFSLKEHIIESLQPHLALCRAEGMWLRHQFTGLWFTPDELAEGMAKGQNLYPGDKWELVEPADGLKTLEIEAHNAQVEVNKWKEKMRVNGYEVPG